MFYLQRNVPTPERIARLLGALLLALAAGLGGLGPALAWGLGLSAVGLLLTALLGFCPACAMIGRRLPKPKE